MKNIIRKNIFIFIFITIIVFLLAFVIIMNNSKNLSNAESNVKIKSKVLKSLIENSWHDGDFGKKESTFDGYDIFFDEGLEVKKVDGQVYNIVFTEKYEKNIINNIKADTKLEEIITELGEPKFGGKGIGLIGYELDNLYIFFNGRQASVYGNINVENISIDFFKDSISVESEFVNTLMENWNDFDNYTESVYGENEKYILINYTHKGIRVSVMNEKIEIIVYNNCNLKIPENDIYDVKIKNKNLVYEIEEERQNSIHNREYAYDQYQSSYNNLPPEFDYDETEQEFKFLQSTKFLDLQKDYNDIGEYKLLFVSIDGEFANSEIDFYVTSNIWVDNYNTVYGVKDKGIYLYNVKTREKSILREGTGDFIIQGITKDNILKYDNNQILVNI